MKVWLDDQCHDLSLPRRWAPEGWIGVETPLECIRFLNKGGVEAISLDMDLGPRGGAGGGYTVALWIEKHATLNGFKVPEYVEIHSANPVQRDKSIAALRKFATVVVVSV